MSAWQKANRILAAGAAIALLSGCQTGEQPRHYRSAYQAFGSLCLVPGEAHSDSLDFLVMQTLRDRGFEPVLTEADDREAIARCRSRVVFSAGDKASGDKMSLTFTDKFTGENYHVTADTTDIGTREFGTGSPLTERAALIKRLVDRLFPESPIH